MRARDNPFRSDRVLRLLRYRLLEGGWDALLARLEALRFRAAIVGPEGSGKTTLLEDLAAPLRARGFEIRELRLDVEHPRFDPQFLDGFFEMLGTRDLILFDGAEQLGRSAWKDFERRSRKAGGLILSAHREGLLPTLLVTSTTPALLEGLIAEILGERPPDLERTASELFAKHRGNLREALREMYDRFAALC